MFKIYFPLTEKYSVNQSTALLFEFTECVDGKKNKKILYIIDRIAYWISPLSLPLNSFQNVGCCGKFSTILNNVSHF